MKSTTFVGLDVHADSIAVAVAFGHGGDPLEMGMIENAPAAIAKLARKLGRPANLRFCYEAGPCGYEIYRQLSAMGASCMVVAPSLIPQAPGAKRRKTDRRDAKNLSRLLRSGDLTPVWVPDNHQEALRDLLRAREEASCDLLRKRHHLGKFLLRLGKRPPTKMLNWSVAHRRWLDSLHFEERAHELVKAEYLHALDEAFSRVERLEKEIVNYVETLADQDLIRALQALRGVGVITAATLVAELGDIGRFETAGQLMSYTGIVPSEHSSGGKRRQGSVTKTGNSHVRRVAIESAWHYRHIPAVGDRLRKRQIGLSEEVKAIAWAAQNRLNRKYRKMLGRGKPRQVAAVAVARELMGFVWAIAQQVSKEKALRTAA